MTELDIDRPLLIRQASLLDGRVCDLRVEAGHIVELASGISSHSHERVIEARGHLLLPGLQDHHLHLFATAAARQSIHCGPPHVHDAEQLRQALLAAPGDDWLRGTGFHHDVCPDLDRHWLDRVCPHRPVRVQHRTGMMWVMNSCALDQLNLPAEQRLPEGAERDRQGRLTGRFYNLDNWLGQRLQRAWPSLRDLSGNLARVGITAVTDTGANNDTEVWQALQSAVNRGELSQRLLVMGNESLNPFVQQAKKSTQSVIQVGPVKQYLREIDLPDLDTLVQRVIRAHEHGRSVAVHCVTRVELYYMLEAFSQAGVRPGDRIEHGSIVDDYAAERLAQLGLTVVTQPHFIAERGDQYRKDVDADDQPWLYRGAGLIEQGVRLAAGSDAPYGSIDPWRSMQAAVERQTPSGVVMAASECLTPRQALNLYAGSQELPGCEIRSLAVGQAADLCLLDCDWQHLKRDLSAEHVALTLCGGRIQYQSPSLIINNVHPIPVDPIQVKSINIDPNTVPNDVTGGTR